MARRVVRRSGGGGGGFKMPSSMKGIATFGLTMVVAGAAIRFLGIDTWVNEKVDSWKAPKAA